MAKKTTEPETVVEQVESVESVTLEIEEELTPGEKASQAIDNLVKPCVMGMAAMKKSGKFNFSLTLDEGNVTGEFYTSFFETVNQ